MTVPAENGEDCFVDGTITAGEGGDGAVGEGLGAGSVGGEEGSELVVDDSCVALDEELDRVDPAFFLCFVKKEMEGGVGSMGCVSK